MIESVGVRVGGALVVVVVEVGVNGEAVRLV